MIDNKDSVQISESCFNVCEVLDVAIQGKNAGGLNESVRTALEDSERYFNQPRPCLLTIPSGPRVTREIERTLRRGASTPHTKHNKESVEGHMLEIERILGALTSLSSPLDGHFSGDEGALKIAPRKTAAISVFGNGVFLASPSLPCEKLIASRSFCLGFRYHSLWTSGQTRVHPA